MSVAYKGGVRIVVGFLQRMIVASILKGTVKLGPARFEKLAVRLGIAGHRLMSMYQTSHFVSAILELGLYTSSS